MREYQADFLLSKHFNKFYEFLANHFKCECDLIKSYNTDLQLVNKKLDYIITELEKRNNNEN